MTQKFSLLSKYLKSLHKYIYLLSTKSTTYNDTLLVIEKETVKKRGWEEVGRERENLNAVCF